jgi:sec-independent protein translocase protein TatA
MEYLAFGMPGGWEWAVIAAFGILIFGKRLPATARAIGSSFTEFKKGLSGVETEITDITKEIKK